LNQKSSAWPDRPEMGVDGVDVLVTREANLNSPLFIAHISQNNDVDPANPFSGTGIAPFELTVHLNAGNSLTFIVFSGLKNDMGYRLNGQGWRLHFRRLLGVLFAEMAISDFVGEEVRPGAEWCGRRRKRNLC
jgi:hypothetical protein